MPADPKIFIHGKVYELGFRTEEGLPFVATPYISLIWESVLARAQTMHPVQLIASVLMGNHSHMIIRVEDPQDVPDFVGYLKKETSHAVNRLIGRKQKTVWKSGYDSPILGDPEKVLERIVYCYTNPQKANLVDKIEDYPGWSTWDAHKSGYAEKEVPRILRSDIPKLPRGSLAIREQQRLADELSEIHQEKFKLTITPDTWIDAFPELVGVDRNKIQQIVIDRVRAAEASYRKTRKAKVLGAARLRMESMTKPHFPKKHGKRMLCMFSDGEIRRSYISWYRKTIRELRDLIQRAGTHLINRPPGLFRPGGGLFSNLTPFFAPVG